MRRLLLLLMVPAVLLGAACVPPKQPAPTPDPEVAECEQGVKVVTDFRPDLNIAPHTCADFGTIPCGPAAVWLGCYSFASDVILMNTHQPSVTQSQYADGFTEEQGHAWDDLRATQADRDRFIEIVGFYDVEAFAEAYRETVYHVPGNLPLDQQQREALCADVMPCQP